jgi:hypothetical protein
MAVQAAKTDPQDRTAGAVPDGPVHNTYHIISTSDYRHTEAEEGKERPDKCIDTEQLERLWVYTRCSLRGTRSHQRPFPSLDLTIQNL